MIGIASAFTGLDDDRRTHDDASSDHTGRLSKAPTRTQNRSIYLFLKDSGNVWLMHFHSLGVYRDLEVGCDNKKIR